MDVVGRTKNFKCENGYLFWYTHEDNWTISLKYGTISTYILTNMHPEILTPEQNALLPLLKRFRRQFYLVGGPVEYMDGYEENEEVIKSFLIEKSLEW